MYTTGTKVKRGSYWSPIDGSSLILRSEGILAGVDNNKYIRVSSPLTLLVSPLFGVMYVMFMPIFGLVVMLAIASIPVLGTIVSLLGQIFNKGYRVRHHSHRTHRKYVI